MISLAVSRDLGEAEAVASEIAGKQGHRIRGPTRKIELETKFGSLCLIAREGELIHGDNVLISCRHITPEEPEFPENLCRVEDVDSIRRTLSGLQGFFSGAWISRDRLVLFRDHVGHMPLAYKQTEEGIFAASERWALGGAAGQLQPGSLLLFDGRRSEIVRWYEPRIKRVADPERLLADVLRKIMDLYLPSECSLAFSGGLDSSIIAYLALSSGKKIDALVIGYEGCLDHSWASEAASLLGIRVKEIIVDDEMVRNAIQVLEKYLPRKSPMDLAIASIFYIASKNSSKKFLVAGQGSDELFGGYRKYADAFERWGIGRAAELMRKDVEQLHLMNLERDELASSLGGSDLIAPYLVKELYELALSIDPELKLRKTGEGIARKWILRKAAERLGLPRELVERPKKAAQYSSGLMKRIRFILSST